MLRSTLALGLSFAVAASSCAQPKGRMAPGIRPPGQRQEASKIYVNGNIYTMDPARPRAEAIGVSGNGIFAVGSNDEVRAESMANPEVIDLQGRTVLPGLIDAHGHMANLGAFGLGRLDLSRATSVEQLVNSVSEAARKAKKGEWIIGGRWDHESWTSRELPTHAALSKATLDNPVWLRRVDGHAGLANEAAMKIAGITRDTQSPAGGEIIKDSRGELTGVFVDNATALIERHVTGPDVTTEDLFLKAQEMCLSAGLTGVHDAGVSPAEVDAYRKLADTGKLKLRVYAMVAGPYAMKYFETHEPQRDMLFSCAAAKFYMDGAMGSRGAWLLEPYSDRPVDAKGAPYTGLAVRMPEEIEAAASHALARGYQVCVHAIGDRANREVLYAYSRALAEARNRNAIAREPRFRIEHAQLLSPADMRRFSALGVIASMQPTHCTSDMRWVEARVGPERAKGAYAWATLLRSGAVIAAGSDFPVESHNPFLGFYAAITRQDESGNPTGGWMPEERMTREEVLHAFTLGAAYAEFAEDYKGSIKSGRLADFIVIDRDVMTCEPREILGTKVLRTVVGGETVYGAK